MSRVGKPINSVKFWVLASVLVAITGCGGGGGDSGGPQTATGVFKDANVGGMTFSSGSQSGTTSADGSFLYEVGKSVTFSVGGVTLGSTTGKSVVTPLDLVTNASTSTPQVQNIVRFLLMLDTDGDPSNGISISPLVQSAAGSWPPVDFTAANLATELTTIVADVATANGVAHTLPDAVTAQSHVQATLSCIRSGGYRGSYTGTDSGPFGVVIDATTGIVSGVAFSNEDDELIVLTGTAAVSPNQSASFVTGSTSTGATFSGSISGADQIAGTWQLPPGESGTFTGSRVGGSANAVYRFTGLFTGDASGFFTFDVNAANVVSGVAYTVTAQAEPGLVVNEVIGLNGTLSGTSLSATTSDGDGSMTGTLSTTNGTLTGNWTDTDGNSGTFTGSGCKLN